jgi:hypothetical protein
LIASKSWTPPPVRASGVRGYLTQFAPFFGSGQVVSAAGATAYDTSLSAG